MKPAEKNKKPRQGGEEQKNLHSPSKKDSSNSQRRPNLKKQNMAAKKIIEDESKFRDENPEEKGI